MRLVPSLLRFAFLYVLAFPLASPVVAQRSAPRVTASNDRILLEYRFDEPELVTVGDLVRVDLPGCANTNRPGEPVLPVRDARILLPAGMEIAAVTSELGEVRELPGIHRLTIGAKQFFRHDGPPEVPAGPDPRIFATGGYWPARAHDVVTVQSKRGFRVAHVNLFPVQYVPNEGRLRMAKTIRVEVRLTATESPGCVRPTAALWRRLRSEVDNASTLRSYRTLPWLGTPSVVVPFNPPSFTPLSDPQSPYFGANWRYVVITTTAFANLSDPHSFQALCQTKAARGIPAGIVPTEWILANYDGARPDGGSDDATRIRNFLIDAYQTWGTEYALLGGDKDIVPPRMFIQAGYEVPADLYYGCVEPADCTFDDNANGDYAQDVDGPGGGDVDLVTDVYVGRAAVEDATDIHNFVEKTFAYETTTAPYLDVVSTMGGYLGFGDIQEFSKPFSELVRLGSDLYLGHFCAGFESPGVPNPRNFTVATLYDEDYAPPGWNRIGHVSPAWDYYSDGWDATVELLPILNGTGIHTTPQIIYTGDHGDHDWGMVKLSTGPHGYSKYDWIGNLTNTDYFFFLDDSCLLGSFDTGNCFAEEITTREHGAFACIVNSREGLGSDGNNLDSVTTTFTREFFHSVLGEGIFQLAPALADARESSLWRLGSIAWFRYQYFEWTLFGDPEVSLRVTTSSK
jgi:hypothetical protein